MMKGSFKLLPLLLIVSVLSFSVRLTEVFTGISSLSGTAFAESKKDKSSDSMKKKQEEAEGEHDEVEVVEGDGKDTKAPKWRDASDSDFDVGHVKLELFEDLSKRRDDLDKYEKDLHMREALLKATEQELDRKYQELTKLRKEIEGLLDDQSEEEGKRVASLVKIYEGMKPKDAARIFDTLDLDVLLAVVSRMSERKVSPVLAAMNPERVRTITIMLVEQKKLPVLR
ncbi:MAG: flagellar protein FlbB [Zetaproteobacteria bacterium]|nr:MAG: flagellar protein FlbB [Zetaproteobacteria bacterium]